MNAINSDMPAASSEAGLHSRAKPFGFECRACSRCCYDKRIQVNPYETAALAERLAMDVVRFRRDHTEGGMGVYLARRDDGACTFLRLSGCSVHPARPLVCRLYPLGRIRHADGSEEWQTLEPHPQSSGRFTETGTIGSFLEQQQALTLMAVADGYADWVNRARSVLAGQRGADAGQAKHGVVPEADLLDLDAATQAWCRARGRAWPDRLQDRWKVHLELLHEQLDHLEGEHDEAKNIR